MDGLALDTPAGDRGGSGGKGGGKGGRGGKTAARPAAVGGALGGVRDSGDKALDILRNKVSWPYDDEIIMYDPSNHAIIQSINQSINHMVD